MYPNKGYQNIMYKNLNGAGFDPFQEDVWPYAEEEKKFIAYARPISDEEFEDDVWGELNIK